MNRRRHGPETKTSKLAILVPLALSGLVLGGAFLANSGLRHMREPDSVARLQTAENDFRAGSGAAAVRLFTPLAKAGNTTAQYWLAKMYLYGTDIKPDATHAIDLLTKAASHGNVAAELLLGETYLNGLHTLQDFRQARLWLGKAAHAGNAPAERDLARIYAQGWGVAPDPVEAYAWDAVAAAHGDAWATSERNRILRTLAGPELTEAQARARSLNATIGAAAAPSSSIAEGNPTANPLAPSDQG